LSGDSFWADLSLFFFFMEFSPNHAESAR